VFREIDIVNKDVIMNIDLLRIIYTSQLKVLKKESQLQ